MFYKYSQCCTYFARVLWISSMDTRFCCRERRLSWSLAVCNQNTNCNVSIIQYRIACRLYIHPGQERILRALSHRLPQASHHQRKECDKRSSVKLIIELSYPGLVPFHGSYPMVIIPTALLSCTIFLVSFCITVACRVVIADKREFYRMKGKLHPFAL